MSNSALRKRLGYLAVALLILGFTLAMADRASSPVIESVGEVQSVGFVLADSPPRRVASIRLATGELVNAKVDSALIVKPGTKVRVRASKRVFSGANTYEVLGSESAK